MSANPGNPHPFSDSGSGSGLDHPSGWETETQRQAHTGAHSGLGIASFTLAIFSGFSIFGLILFAGLYGSSDAGGVAEDSVLAILIGIAAMAIVAMNVLGVALAIAGVVQTSHRRTFGVIGLLCNVFVSLLLIVLTIIGIAVGA